MAAFAQLATGHQSDQVIGAAANIVVNALRQSHAKLGEAEQHMDEVVEGMRKALRHKHYDQQGNRNDRCIVVPPLRQLAD